MNIIKKRYSVFIFTLIFSLVMQPSAVLAEENVTGETCENTVQDTEQEHITKKTSDGSYKKTCIILNTVSCLKPVNVPGHLICYGRNPAGHGGG